MGIAERLRQVLKSKNLSLRSVSRMTGIPYRSLQNYVGGIRLPSIDNLLKLYTHLGINLHWLITGDLMDKNNINAVLDAICKLLSDMSEDEQRDILKFIKEKKLLKELLLERQKKDVE